MNFLDIYDRDYAPRLGVRAGGFRRIFELLEAASKPWPVIIETGCLRQAGNWEGDGQSTILFNEYVKTCHGSRHSVDIDPDAVEVAQTAIGERSGFHIGDSVWFLRSASMIYRHIDLLYLDSFDLDTRNPMPAAIHHLMELCSIMPSLGEGSIVAVDDNFVGEDNSLVGKGMLLLDYFKKLGIDPVFVGYQIIWVMP